MKKLTNLHFVQLQNKVHGFAIGMTLGLGSMYIGQVCPALGQCPTCGGACVARLPVLALPLLADGAFMLYGRLRQRMGEAPSPEAELQGGEQVV